MIKTSTFKNILANYGTKLWGFVSIYLFIPLYIKFLGVEAYAIISFYSLILGLISFADAGLSSGITREFAKDISASDKYGLLSVVEKYYALICSVILVSILCLASIIASKWLNSQTFEISAVSYYIRLIGFGVVLQLISSLYFGALMGLQVQVYANGIQLVWSIIRTIGIIIIFYFYKPSLELFLVWQIGCNLIYVIVLRYCVIAQLKNYVSVLVKTITKLPPEIKSYISGMAVVALISSINTQADKLVTSSLFSLSEFSYYSIASTLSQVPMLLASPLAIAVFPIFSKLAANKNTMSQEVSFKSFNYLLNILIIPVGLCIFLYAKDIIIIWTGERMFSEHTLLKIVTIVRLLTVGGVFLALQLLPFYFLISNGKTKYNIRQGLIQLIFGVPALYFFINYYGIVGAGIPWVLINFCAFFYLYFILFSTYLKERTYVFFKDTLLVPILITSLVTLFLYFILNRLSGVYILIVPSLICVISVGLNIAYQNYLRKNKFYEIAWLLNY